jgi:nicotinamidase-related amidase
MPDIVGAKPYPYRLPRNSTALVMIDMQRDFLEPGGFGAALGNDVTRLAPAVSAAGWLIEAFRLAGLPIIHTKEAHRRDLSDCPPAKRARGNGSLRIGDPGPMGRILVSGEPGNDFVHELRPMPGEIVLEKPGKGAFCRTDFEVKLAKLGVTHLVFGGVTTEVCVQTTMREANDRGFECLLAEEATESYFPEFKQATIDMIRAQGGIVGWTASVSEIVEALKGRD